MAVVDVKEKITTLAEVRDWPRTKIAKNADIPQSTLESAFRGQELGITKAINIARVMDVPVEWLFDDKLSWSDLPRAPFWWPPNLPLPSDDTK